MTTGDESRTVVGTLGGLVPRPLKTLLRPLARRFGFAEELPWWLATRPPFDRIGLTARRSAAWCNICDWRGPSFDGPAHSEYALCPQCGSIARDRYLFAAFSRTPRPKGLRVLETSPRLASEYRAMMRRWFAYQCSDFDLSAHRADIALDLQHIDLPDGSIDVLMTPHVLEHVPDTGAALTGIYRMLAPGGRMYLQVPLLQGTTAPPAEPEFHADNTPVRWRFGWDLTEQLRAVGFETKVLVTQDFYRLLTTSPSSGLHEAGEFDVPSIVADVVPADLEVMVKSKDADRLGFVPAFQFATWECIKRSR